jgi:GNAT superfamily N-acetyltransferase
MPGRPTTVHAVVTIEQPVRGPAAEFQREVLGSLSDFWDGRDVRHLHQAVWFRQFRSAAQAVRTADGALCAYLLGCVTLDVAYVHAVATLPQARGAGLARRMYEHVFELADAGGCRTVEAVTGTGNAASIAFHRSMGFSASLVQDYAGPAEPRMHFVRPPGRARRSRAAD